MSEAITRGIRVRVRAEFVPQHSEPDDDNFFFAYHITIRNEGEEPVRLISRHWIIADSSGKEQEVKGLGVVGQQPRLEPGESFQYTSACPLSTRVDARKLPDADEPFDVRIAPFTLAVPGVLN